MYPSTKMFTFKDGYRLKVKIKQRKVTLQSASVVAGKNHKMVLTNDENYGYISGSKTSKVSTNEAAIKASKIKVSYNNGANTPVITAKASKPGTTTLKVTLSKGVVLQQKVVVKAAPAVKPAPDAAKPVADDVNTDATATVKTTEDENGPQTKVVDDTDNTSVNTNTDGEAKADADAEAEAARKAAEEAARKAEAEAAAKAAEEARIAEGKAQLQTEIAMKIGDTTNVVLPDGFRFVNVEGRFGVIDVKADENNNVTITALKKGVVFVTFMAPDGEFVQAPVGVIAE
jgi:hypothetical protein